MMSARESGGGGGGKMTPNIGGRGLKPKYGTIVVKWLTNEGAGPPNIEC